MEFLIDENVPALVAAALRSGGHDCIAVAETATQTPDGELLEIARRDKRILVTFDSDFARLIFHELRPAPIGVVYMRSRPTLAATVAKSFIALFEAGRIDLAGHFVTIDMGGIVRSVPLEQSYG